MAERGPAAPSANPVPFKEAIRHLREKVNLPSRVWTDLWHGMHARAFVVAGAIKGQLVADLHDAVVRAIDEGLTIADFRRDFDKIVADHVWSYKGGRNWRTSVIFNTNMRTAYAAGKWEQAQRLKDRRPYLRYVAVQDERTRPEHLEWHGTVLPADHPWWETHFPPNGWNCRCTVQQLSAADAERLGYEIADEAPPVEMETRSVNTPDGPKTIQVPKGIDTGFGYNVGLAAHGRGIGNARLDAHGDVFKPLEAPGGHRPSEPAPLTARPPRAKVGALRNSESGLRSALRDAIGGDERILADPAGERVAVGQAIVDHMLKDASRRDGREKFFPLIPELIEDPAEIWVGFARNERTGRVAIRRRYVKLVAVDKKTTVGLVADSDDGQWSGLTFYRGGATGLNNLRTGLRVYREE